MKKSEKQLRAFIREAIDYMITQPNQAQRSLPHSYQFDLADTGRRRPEVYLSDEQNEKYGNKLSRLRLSDPHQTDALVAPLIGDSEPPGFYDKNKSYTEEIEALERIHGGENAFASHKVPLSGKGKYGANMPAIEDLRGYTNKEMRTLYRKAKDIYEQTVAERDAEQRDLGNDARARRMVGYFDEDMQDRTGLYKYLVKLAYSRDVITAANNLKKYITDKDYENERKDLASFPDGQHVLKLLRNTIKSLEKQYKDTMKYYHYGTMPQRDNEQ